MPQDGKQTDRITPFLIQGYGILLAVIHSLVAVLSHQLRTWYWLSKNLRVANWPNNYLFQTSSL